MIVLADGDDAGEAAAKDCAVRWKREGDSYGYRPGKSALDAYLLQCPSAKGARHRSSPSGYRPEVLRFFNRARRNIRRSFQVCLSRGTQNQKEGALQCKAHSGLSLLQRSL